MKVQLIASQECLPLIWRLETSFIFNVMGQRSRLPVKRPKKNTMMRMLREEPLMIWLLAQEKKKNQLTNPEEKLNSRLARKKSSTASCQGKKKLNANSLPEAPPQIINGPSLRSIWKSTMSHHYIKFLNMTSWHDVITSHMKYLTGVITFLYMSKHSKFMSNLNTVPIFS